MIGAFTEWLNANSSRNYPIIENLDRKDSMGIFTLPNEFIVAMQVNFSREYVDGQFFIKEVSSFANSCYLVIGYATETTSEAIAKINVDYSTHKPYQYYSFVGEGEHFAIVGSICINSVEDLKNVGFGQFEFLPSSTAIEPNCLFVSVPALKSVEVYSGTSLIHVATDVLRLKAGENIRLTYEDAGEDGRKIIRIDAINGLNLEERDTCDNDPYIKKECIKTINGIGPDEQGDFKILGSECIRIDPETNGISVHDLCSQSCCGCEELNELVSGLDAVRAQEAALKMLMDSVQSQQANYISKLASNVI